MGAAGIEPAIFGGGRRFARGGALGDVWAECAVGDLEAALDELDVSLEARVLVFDRDRAVVAGGVERGKEAWPVHLAEARQARSLPSDSGGEGAVAVEAVAVDL